MNEDIIKVFWDEIHGNPTYIIYVEYIIYMYIYIYVCIYIYIYIMYIYILYIHMHGVVCLGRHLETVDLPAD